MRLEIAERMRCPRAHRVTPLVVVARRSIERELLDGVAGCMSCYLEAEIAAGDVRFPAAQSQGPDASQRDGDDVAAAAPLPPDHAARVLALLGLAEPGGAILLTGRYANLAAQLAESVELSAIALNADAPPANGVSRVWLAEPAVPFSDGTFRGIALDAGTPLPVIVDALRTLAVGGRLLGAASLEPPHGVRVLARDELEWVGEKEAGVPPVLPLRRA